MADLSKIEDPTPPEEYERRAKERKDAEDARQQERMKQGAAALGQQMQASAEKDARLQRIEAKLDQILDLLGKGDA